MTSLFIKLTGLLKLKFGINIRDLPFRYGLVPGEAQKKLQNLHFECGSLCYYISHLDLQDPTIISPNVNDVPSESGDVFTYKGEDLTGTIVMFNGSKSQVLIYDTDWEFAVLLSKLELRDVNLLFSCNADSSSLDRLIIGVIHQHGPIAPDYFHDYVALMNRSGDFSIIN